MLLNIIIFAAIVAVIALVTVILIKWLNKVFGWLASKLAKTRTENTAAETSGIRKALKTPLNVLLATFIGLLSFVLCLEGTILNSDFVTAELQKLDMAAIASELFSEGISVELSGNINELASEHLSTNVAGLSQEQFYGAESVEATLAEVWPELNKQVNAAVLSVYDYFLGEQTNLNVVIPLENVQSTLKENLQELVLQSPPAELKGGPPEQIQLYAAGIYQEQFEGLPAELKVTPDTVVKYFSVTLGELRWFTTALPLIPTLLLVVIGFLVVGVVLVNRDFKTVFWNLGITLVVSTLVGQLYIRLAREAGTRAASIAHLPTLNVWIIEVATDVLVFINGIFEITLAIGAGMITVSLFFMLLHKFSKKKATRVCVQQ